MESGNENREVISRQLLRTDVHFDMQSITLQVPTFFQLNMGDNSRVAYAYIGPTVRFMERIHLRIGDKNVAAMRFVNNVQYLESDFFVEGPLK